MIPPRLFAVRHLRNDRKPLKLSSSYGNVGGGTKEEAGGRVQDRRHDESLVVRDRTVLSWYRPQNSKYDHVEEGKKDHRPHEPGKFPLELLVFAHTCTRISSGRTFGSYKAHGNAQAHGRTYGGASHFHEQRLVARFAENQFVARFWRFKRLFER